MNFTRPARWGLAAVALLLGGSLIWASLAEVSGAIITQGKVGVRGEAKTIQHADGGIVKVIHISTGDAVKAGDVLIELDSATLMANLSIYRARLRDGLLRRARILSELDEAVDIELPSPQDVSNFRLQDIDKSAEQQRVLMRVRQQTRDGEIAQLDKKIVQMRSQIEGATRLLEEKRTEIQTYQQEQESVRRLIDQSAVAKNRLLTFDRAVADLRGQIASQEAEIGRLQASIAETEIARLQIGKEMREKNAAELEQTETSISELKQQIIATDLQLQRTSIRAPVDGVIHELAMHTIGGVIQPGQAIMQIVPVGSALEIDVNADTRSIDEVTAEARTIVRFPAFHERTTPEIFGTVKRISPSSIVDEKTGAAFYRIAIEVPASEVSKLGDKKLIPGMPVEAVIPTENRTVLSYLLKPLSDQFKHALREL